MQGDLQLDEALEFSLPTSLFNSSLRESRAFVVVLVFVRMENGQDQVLDIFHFCRVAQACPLSPRLFLRACGDTPRTSTQNTCRATIPSTRSAHGPCSVEEDQNQAKTKHRVARIFVFLYSTEFKTVYEHREARNYLHTHNFLTTRSVPEALRKRKTLPL